MRMAASFLVFYAYSFRGYSAIGGEWCCILAIGLAIYHLIKKIKILK